ncbi:hypothetical protein P3S68_003374 [Capsicum galapagoense]
MIPFNSFPRLFFIIRVLCMITRYRRVSESLWFGMPVTARVPARVVTLSGNLHNGLCNGLPKLQELHLSENKLHGHMSKSLSNCSQLQKLSLSENVFDGPIHSGIGRLANLQMSSLGSNHFTSMIYLVNARIMPQEIGDLVNLMKLGVERSDYWLCPNLHFQHLISAIFVSVEKQSQWILTKGYWQLNQYAIFIS